MDFLGEQLLASPGRRESSNWARSREACAGGRAIGGVMRWQCRFMQAVEGTYRLCLGRAIDVGVGAQQGGGDAGGCWGGKLGLRAFCDAGVVVGLGIWSRSAADAAAGCG